MRVVYTPPLSLTSYCNNFLDSRFDPYNPTGVSGNDRYTHYAGFIGGAFIRPGVTNEQGVALEATPDNDDDGLTDTAEVSGSAFEEYAVTDPNRADTDGDGMSDADEAAGMYDPNDPDHALRVISLVGSADTLTLTWIGKGGGVSNTILWCGDLATGALTNILDVGTYVGGTAPWYKATNTHVWVESGYTTRFFRVMTK